MAITYTWELDRLSKKDVGDLSEAVIEIGWKCVGTNEDGITGVFWSTTAFDASSISAENFTAYTDLTKEQVLGWVQTRVEADSAFKTHMQERIQVSINEKINPVQVVNNPFVDADEEPDAAPV
jgi:hypothetical protein